MCIRDRCGETADPICQRGYRDGGQPGAGNCRGGLSGQPFQWNARMQCQSGTRSGLSVHGTKIELPLHSLRKGEGRCDENDGGAGTAGHPECADAAHAGITLWGGISVRP